MDPRAAPGGRLAVMDSQFDPSVSSGRRRMRGRAPNSAIGDRLPFLGGRPQAEIEALFKAHGLVDVAATRCRIW
jgi:hypothetical protein